MPIDFPSRLPVPTPPIPVEKKKSQPVKVILWVIVGMIIGVVGIIIAIQYGVSSQLITVTNCINYANQSSISGVSYGIENTIATITEEAIQCNQIPINYLNYSYTLIALECLQGAQE